MGKRKINQKRRFFAQIGEFYVQNEHVLAQIGEFYVQNVHAIARIGRLRDRMRTIFNQKRRGVKMGI